MSIRSISVLVFSLLLIGSVGVVATTTTQVQSIELSTSVSLNPEKVELSSGQQETVNIVVDSAQNGISAFDIGVRVADNSVAEITDATFAVPLNEDRAAIDPSWAVNNDPNPGGTSLVSIRVAGTDTADTGSVTVARVTIKAKERGTTDLQLLAQTVGNEESESYTITASNDATIIVDGGATPIPTATPTPSGNQAPTVEAVIDGDQLPDESYTSPATVSLSASDPDGQVQRIEYRVDGGSFQQVSGSSTSFDITEDGTHTVEYRAVDDEGKTSETEQLEVTVGSDSNPIDSFTVSDPGTDIEAILVTTEPLTGLEVSTSTGGQTIQTLTKSEIASETLDNGKFRYRAVFRRVEEGTNYDVTLERAETGSGNWATGQTRTVTVEPEKVQLNLTVDDTTIVEGRTVQFEVTRESDSFSVRNATITVDGETLETGTEHIAEYTFTDPGVYTATVTKARDREREYLSDSVRIEVRGQAGNTELGGVWATFQGDYSRAGYRPGSQDLNDDPVEDWRRYAQSIGAAPVVADGVVYTSRGNEFAAIDTDTGELIWTYSMDAELQATPVVIEDKRDDEQDVYLADVDGRLHALNATTGEARWTKSLSVPGRSSGEVRNEFAVIDDIAYVPVDDPEDGPSTNPDALVAVNLRTQSVLWTYKSGHIGSVADEDEKLYVAAGEEEMLLKLSPGEENGKYWSYTTPTENGLARGEKVLGAPSIRNETVYIKDETYRVRAIDTESGDPIWNSSQLPGGAASPPDNPTSAAVTDDRVIVPVNGNSDGHLYALDSSTGVREWNFSIENESLHTPIVVADTVYVMSERGDLYALDRQSGARKWTHETDGSGFPESAIAYADGRIFFVGSDLNMHVLTRPRLTLDSVSDRTVAAGDSIRIEVGASNVHTDNVVSSPDASVPSLSLSGAPEFVTLTDGGNGTGDITVSPGLSDAGTYQFEVVASDDRKTVRDSVEINVTGSVEYNVETGSATDLRINTTTAAATATLNGTLSLGQTAEATTYVRFWVQGQPETKYWYTGETRSTPGEFDTEVTLSPSTTYVWQALSESDGGSWKVGETKTFTTPTGPFFGVGTDPATDVGVDSATLNGQLLELGDNDNARVYFNYWEQGRKNETSKWHTGTVRQAAGSFATTVQTAPDTTYDYRALAKSDEGEWKVGPIERFTTEPDQSFAISTDPATDVGARSAILNGELTGLGNKSSARVYLTYWEQGRKNETLTWYTGSVRSEPGSLQTTIEVASNTTYKYRAFAKSADGTWKAGRVLTFRSDGGRLNVTGRIVDYTDNGVLNDRVVVENGRKQNLTTDTNGRFEFTGVAGEYAFLYIQGNESSTTDDEIPDLRPLGTRNISADTNLGTFSLPEAHDVNVRVVDADGTPVENAIVGVVQANENSYGFLERATNASGQIPSTDGRGYDLAGEVSLYVIPPNNGQYANDTYVRNLTITDDTTVTFQLDEADPTITGRLTLSNGSAAINDAVIAYPRTGTFSSDVTNTSGTFELTLDRDVPHSLGYYQADGTDEPGPYLEWNPEDFPRDDNVDMFALVNVTIEQNTDLGSKQLPEGHVVEVVVQNESGAPVQDANVSIYHYNGNYLDTSSGSTGWIELTRDDGRIYPNNVTTGLELAGNVTITAEPPEGSTEYVDKTYTRNITVNSNTIETIQLDETQSGDVLFEESFESGLGAVSNETGRVGRVESGYGDGQYSVNISYSGNPRIVEASTRTEFSDDLEINYATKIRTNDRYAGAHFEYNGYLLKHSFQNQSISIVIPGQKPPIASASCSLESDQWYSGTIRITDEKTVWTFDGGRCELTTSESITGTDRLGLRGFVPDAGDTVYFDEIKIRRITDSS